MPVRVTIPGNPRRELAPLSSHFAGSLIKALILPTLDQTLPAIARAAVLLRPASSQSPTSQFCLISAASCRQKIPLYAQRPLVASQPSSACPIPFECTSHAPSSPRVLAESALEFQTLRFRPAVRSQPIAQSILASLPHAALLPQTCGSPL